MQRRLLDTYGVTEGRERDLLLSLARESRERGWWQQYGEVVPEWFATYVGLEAEAATISTYRAETVPGLLQTQRYAEALHRAQLMKLATVATAPNITLQVLPFGVGAHASMDSAFSIISFDPPSDGDIVFFEHPTCSLYLEKPEEVARYRLVYEHLRAASLSLDESRRLIARSAEDLA